MAIALAHHVYVRGVSRAEKEEGLAQELRGATNVNRFLNASSRAIPPSTRFATLLLTDCRHSAVNSTRSFTDE